MSRAQLTIALALGVAGVGAGAGALALSRTHTPAPLKPSDPPQKDKESVSPAIPCPARTLADEGACIPAERAQREGGIAAEPQTRDALPEGAEPKTATWHTNALTPFGAATTALSWQVQRTEVRLPTLAATDSLRLIAWGPRPGDGASPRGSLSLSGDATWLLFVAQRARADSDTNSLTESRRLVLVWGLSSKAAHLKLQREIRALDPPLVGMAKHGRVWLAVRRARTGVVGEAPAQSLGTKEVPPNLPKALPASPNVADSLAAGRWRHSLPLAMSHWLGAELNASP